MLNFPEETSSIAMPEISNYGNTVINNYDELVIDKNKCFFCLIKQ